MNLIYLDYNATTPVDPEVLKAMMPYFLEHYGNPASQLHAMGWQAKNATDQARLQVAQLLNCEPQEITFTSGSTESHNWALKGLVESLRSSSPGEKIHVISTQVEHASVREPLMDLAQKGHIDVDFLATDSQGYVRLEQFQKALKPTTRLVSVIWVQNEIGTIQKISEIANWCFENDLYFHTDATQAVGKIPVDLKQIPISLLSFSSHKIYGPKGVGALFLRQKNPKVSLTSLLHGGNQERLGRSGTLNVPGIVGMGKACEIAGQLQKTDTQKFSNLSKRLWEQLQKKSPLCRLNGPPLGERIGNTLSVTFSGVQPFEILPKIQKLCVSAGSACSSAQVQGSPTLVAIGHSLDDDSITLRLSCGRFTTENEVDLAAEILGSALKSPHPQI